MKNMKCIKCNVEIHPKRLEIIPGCKTCVNCSTSSPKRGVPTLRGTGDHTWVELDIMDEETFIQFESLRTGKDLKLPKENIIYDEDDNVGNVKPNLDELDEC